MSLPLDKNARKERPIARGVLDYFPDAIAEVAYVSFVGNRQHNPGEPMHWARGKSADHADCVARHLIERGTVDVDGLRHSAKAAWRSLALLQEELEAAEAGDVSVMSNEQLANALGGEVEYADNPVAEAVCPCRKTEPAQPDLSESLAFTGGNVGIADVDKEIEYAERVEAAYNAAAKGCDYPAELIDRRALDVRHLSTLGCKNEVACQIANGTTYTPEWEHNVVQRYVYVAGPMRGYPEFNFPAFDHARDLFVAKHWNVISPADIDRNAGDTDEKKGTHDDVRIYVYRDFFALFLIAYKGDGAIAMLPGWEKSTGAVAEFFLARWLGLKILDARTGEPLKEFNKTQFISSLHTFLISQLPNGSVFAVEGI